MKALTWQGTRNVRVQTVADPVLQQPDDLLLRVTATAGANQTISIQATLVAGGE